MSCDTVAVVLVPEIVWFPCLFALTVASAEAWRNRPACARYEQNGAVLLLGQTLLIAAMSFLVVIIVEAPDGKRFTDYCTWFVGTPMSLQRAAGTLLVIAPGWIAYEGWRAKSRSGRTHAVAIAACVTWIIVHGRLPIRLSAPDFDDFFVVGKFTGAIQPGWHNDKPYFTFWDLPYRLLDAPGDPLARFRINGWFAISYFMLAGLWIEHLLESRFDPSRPRAPAWLAWAAAFNLGFIVLSNGPYYELACATWILAIGLVLERMRIDQKSANPFALLCVLLLARALQSGGDDANALAWSPVFVHGVLVTRRWRTPRWMQFAAIVVLGSAVLDIVLRERRALSTSLHTFDAPKAIEVVVGGALPLALALLWLRRRAAGSPTLRSIGVSAWQRPGSVHVWLAYMLCGAAVYLLANQGYYGLPIPGWKHFIARFFANIPWDSGANHARYAAFFYPWLATLLLWLLWPRGRRGVVALAVSAFSWNAAYVLLFYGGARAASADTSAYGRNSRFLDAMRATLPALGAARTIAFIPIPRDHGDHYLMRVADQHIGTLAACSTEARAQPNLPLVVSGYTLHVLEEAEHLNMLLPGLDDIALRRDIMVLHMRDLAPIELDSWCGRTSRRFDPVPGQEACR